jgi:hypothetical protein
MKPTILENQWIENTKEQEQSLFKLLNPIGFKNKNNKLQDSMLECSVKNTGIRYKRVTQKEQKIMRIKLLVEFLQNFYETSHSMGI